jgi:hypothetical protein
MEIRHEKYNALLRNVSGPYNSCNNYAVYHINQAQDHSTQSGNDFAFLNPKYGLCISPFCNDQKEPPITNYYCISKYGKKNRNLLVSLILLTCEG